MNGKLIVITGYLASGKSTFARRLSKELNVPYIIKDTFKSALCAGIPIENRAESSHFSAVTFDGIIYVTERMLETGTPLIIEGNFAPRGVKAKDEAWTIKALAVKYNCHTLTYKFKADTAVLHDRYVERDKLPERGQANKLFSEPSYDEFDVWCNNLDGFDIGGTAVEIDTTDFTAVDYEKNIKTARKFLSV